MNPRNRKIKVFALVLLSFLVIVLGYFVVAKDFNPLISLAQSKNYNKTYPAGTLVNYGNTANLVYGHGLYGQNARDARIVKMKSNGKTVRMPARPGGPMIKGWRSDPVAKTVGGETPVWDYYSKTITIPKNKSRRPMAVYICWKALTGKNTTIKVQLKRGITAGWQTKHGDFQMNYNHGHETLERTRQTACWGWYDVAWFVNEPYEFQKMNKPVKAKVLIWVAQGQVDISSIKVFNPTKPDWSVTGKWARQDEADITD